MVRTTETLAINVTVNNPDGYLIAERIFSIYLNAQNYLIDAEIKVN